MAKSVAVCFVLLVGTQAAIALAGDLRVVALSNTVAPGAANTSFSEFGAPKINDIGQAAFTASLTGPNVTDANEAGIWSERFGPLGLVARTGDTAPGTSALFKTFHFTPRFNALGQSSFRADLVGAGVTQANDQGIWSEGTGSLALVARSGDPAPGTNGLAFTRPTFMHPKLPPSLDPFGNPSFNDVGQTAFYAYLPSIGIDQFANGIWSEGSGPVSLVARTFDNAPGIAGATLQGVGPNDNIPFSNSGQVNFSGALTGAGVTVANDRAKWLHQNGMSSLFLRDGDSAPEITNATYDGVATPVYNGAGQYAFFAMVLGPGITAANNRAIWSNADGPLKLLIRAGDIAPETGGAIFDPQSSSVRFNDRGETLFFSSLTGPGVTFDNSFGMWLEKDGVVQLVARRGNVAPETGGALFSFVNTSSVALNNRGQIAFHSSLTGPGVTPSNMWGIWGEGGDGIQKLIVRSGQSLEVAPGDFRIIEELGLLEEGFNNFGQLAFLATFVDGTSGIFVSNVLAVPEPSSQTTLVLTLLLFSVAHTRSYRPA